VVELYQTFQKLLFDKIIIKFNMLSSFMENRFLGYVNATRLSHLTRIGVIEVRVSACNNMLN